MRRNGGQLTGVGPDGGDSRVGASVHGRRGCRVAGGVWPRPFDDSDLYNSKFIGASLHNTSFRNCNVKNTNFTDIYQENVSFKLANTRAAIFSEGMNPLQESK